MKIVLIETMKDYAEIDQNLGTKCMPLCSAAVLYHQKTLLQTVYMLKIPRKPHQISKKREKLQIIDNYLYMSIRKHNIINLSQPSPIMEIYTFYY